MTAAHVGDDAAMHAVELAGMRSGKSTRETAARLPCATLRLPDLG